MEMSEWNQDNILVSRPQFCLFFLISFWWRNKLRKCLWFLQSWAWRSYVEVDFWHFPMHFQNLRKHKLFSISTYQSKLRLLVGLESICTILLSVVIFATTAHHNYYGKHASYQFMSLSYVCNYPLFSQVSKYIYGHLKLPWDYGFILNKNLRQWNSILLECPIERNRQHKPCWHTFVVSDQSFRKSCSFHQSK